MKTIKVFFILLIFSSAAIAQVTQQWTSFYSNNDGGDMAYKVALDGAGNIYAAGVSYDSISGMDYVTVKYNTNGVQQWVQRYNGFGNGDDYGQFLSVDLTGNVYVSGRSKGNGTKWDYATIKYNTNGVQQWVQRYNGTGNGNDQVTGMEIDNLGNVYVTGSSFVPIPNHPDSGYVFATIKYNSIGSQVWVKKFNVPPTTLNPGNDFPTALTVDNFGNIYVTGKSMAEGGHPYGFMQYCVTIKYNSSGDSVWVARFFDPDTISTSQILPTAIAVNSSGNVVVTGTCALNNSYTANRSDYFTLKYNSSGIYQWFKIYNGPGPTGGNDDQPTSIAVDINNVYVTGVSKGSNSDWDYATVKYDYSGVQQWVKRYNGTGNGNDMPAAIKLDSLGNSYITGNSIGSGTYEDIVTIKYDYFGNQIWLVRYNGALNYPDGGSSLALHSSGNLFVTGMGDGKMVTIKYAQSIGIQNISSEVPSKYSLGQNYPNPFNPNTVISFQLPVVSCVTLIVYDAIGREITTLVNESLQPGIYEVNWDASRNPSGVYFYKLTTDGFTQTKRMTLVK